MSATTSKTALQLYKPSGGKAVTVRVRDGSIWVTMQEMAQLFNVDRTGVVRHLKTIFETGELKRKATSTVMATKANDGKVYKVEYFNLDAVLSVGYRVNSKEGTRFRIWANEVLGKHLLRGYTINQQRLRQSRLQELEKLEKTVGLIRAAVDLKELSGDEAKGLLHVITDYAKSWATLQQFDEGTLPPRVRTTKKVRDLEEKEADRAVEMLTKQLTKKGEAGELFAREQRPDGMRSILRNIHQTFDGKPLYMSVEERAAHLLYFVIKDHPFIDGNKRIGSLLFLLFLKRHGRLTTKSGKQTITDSALVAIALLIAQSKPQEKETMIALVQNLL